MEKVTVSLKHCYGIRALEHEFDFSSPAYAIYAPNGAMKSSFAQTFLDLSKGQSPRDRVFPTNKSEWSVLDEQRADIKDRQILVVIPIDKTMSPNEETSVLLVNPELKEKYNELFREIDKMKNDLITSIKKKLKSKTDFEAEISNLFTRGDGIYVALGRIVNEVTKMGDPIYENVEYDTVFNDKVMDALADAKIKGSIENYIAKYNKLLDDSQFFRRGTFDYYNADQIADSLTKNGFFTASHTVNLKSAGKTVEIKTKKELQAIIKAEQDQILTDPQLETAFKAVDDKLTKNADLRNFARYLQRNPALLSRMDNPEKLREDVLKSYLKANQEAVVALVAKHEAAQKTEEDIRRAAQSESTTWDEVIKVFNARFVVPFELGVKNKYKMQVGQEVGKPSLAFHYKEREGEQRAAMEPDKLLEVLSNGEQKALYILNVLFQVEIRKSDVGDTLLIVDDLADSFDYQNKYAIIHYLKDISRQKKFKLIILTHNFDFFRTLESRFVQRDNCLMANRTAAGISLVQFPGIKNIFAHDWKPRYHLDSKKRVACIPFLRNLIEYTHDKGHDDYKTLTSLLHWKPNSETIKVKDLDRIFTATCNKAAASPDPDRPVCHLILEQAEICLGSGDGVNLESKVVLAIAIRLIAEKFMVEKINDQAFWEHLKKDQTANLHKRFLETSPSSNTRETLDRVLLMTPENIHLNSFMYEPLIDMSDDLLKRLYVNSKALA